MLPLYESIVRPQALTPTSLQEGQIRINWKRGGIQRWLRVWNQTDRYFLSKQVENFGFHYTVMNTSSQYASDSNDFFGHWLDDSQPSYLIQANVQPILECRYNDSFTHQLSLRTQFRVSIHTQLLFYLFFLNVQEDQCTTSNDGIVYTRITKIHPCGHNCHGWPSAGEKSSQLIITPSLAIQRLSR